MDSRKYMLLVNGQDKTDSVASFRFQDGMCDVVYSSAPQSPTTTMPKKYSF